MQYGKEKRKVELHLMDEMSNVNFLIRLNRHNINAMSIIATETYLRPPLWRLRENTVAVALVFVPARLARMTLGPAQIEFSR